MRLVLASQSPRRKELLSAAAIPHEVRVANIDESVLADEDALAYVLRVARLKAEAMTPGDDEVILAADTSVVCEGQILGKPRDREDAARMLALLSGKRHEVITGICLRHRDVFLCASESTGVWLGTLSEQEIADYAASGEPMDKAGAYAIQGIASRFVERIEGSYSNVVGLPVALVWRELLKLGFRASL